MLLCPQATTYKLDFEQERSDRVEEMGRFETEREILMTDMARVNEKLAAKHLELDDALGKLEQLKELSVAQKEKVIIKPDSASACSTSVVQLTWEVLSHGQYFFLYYVYVFISMLLYLLAHEIMKCPNAHIYIHVILCSWCTPAKVASRDANIRQLEERCEQLVEHVSLASLLGGTLLDV